MNKKIIIPFILLFAVIVLFGCTQTQNNSTTPNTSTQTNNNPNGSDFFPNETPGTQDESNTTLPGTNTQPPAEPPPVSQSPTPVSINIQNFSFSPSTITIPVVTTVTWTNMDSVRHTATSDNGVFDSGLLSQNQTYSYTFNTPGTYTYHCTPHPNMKATIIVQ